MLVNDVLVILAGFPEVLTVVLGLTAALLIADWAIGHFRGRE